MNDFSLLAMFAGLAAVWSQIRSLLDRARSLVLQRVTLNGRIALNVNDYLYSETRVLRWGDLLIRSSSAWVRPLDRVAEVAYESSPVKPLLALWGRVPVLFWCPGTSEGVADTPQTDCILNLTFLRGTVDVNRLTRLALNHGLQQQTTGKRYRVHQVAGRQRNSNMPAAGSLGRPASPPMHADEIRASMRFLHWEANDIGAPTCQRPFDAYVLSPEAAAARQDFQRWCSLRGWYQERGIPWRRGHLLHGPPGTGKTALVRALAQEADMPVYAFDLSTLENVEFREEWQQMQESSPCIALLEDIDGVFRGRENVVRGGEMQGGLSFDCLLNALGGIQSADGVFVVITTNARDTLDPALTRPGRLDREFKLPPPAPEQRQNILTRICGESTPDMLEATDGMTAAQVTEWAISTALHRQWQSAA